MWIKKIWRAWILYFWNTKTLLLFSILTSGVYLGSALFLTLYVSLSITMKSVLKPSKKRTLLQTWSNNSAELPVFIIYRYKFGSIFDLFESGRWLNVYCLFFVKSRYTSDVYCLFHVKWRYTSAMYTKYYRYIIDTYVYQNF